MRIRSFSLRTPICPSFHDVPFPNKVLNHVGETWICFIRIMVKDPFDDQLDIRVIHDREEVGAKMTILESPAGQKE